MQTILRFLKLAQDAKTEADIVQLTEEEANSCVEAGDLLGAGEWLTSKLDYADDQNAEVTLAKVLALWASAGELSFSPINLKDLIANIPLFDRALLAAAVGCLAARRPKVLQKQENILRDLSFRIRDDLNKVFGLQEESPAKIASLGGCKPKPQKIPRSLDHAYSLSPDDPSVPRVGWRLITVLTDCPC